jgi:hypothetical protein
MEAATRVIAGAGAKRGRACRVCLVHPWDLAATVRAQPKQRSWPRWPRDAQAPGPGDDSRRSIRCWRLPVFLVSGLRSADQGEEPELA